MSEREGVIKYHLTHRSCMLDVHVDISEINAWRHLLFKLKLIGQDANRYAGLGFGNISQRLLADRQAFLITGTQTGHLPLLTHEHFAIVDGAKPLRNELFSSGPCQPSSEALTHDCVYRHQACAQAVIHVHSPVLWRQTHALRLPYTDASIDYGSVAMAQAVEELLQCGRLQSLPLFSMLGHEDGIVAFGASLQSAASILLAYLAKAMAIEFGKRYD